MNREKSLSIVVNMPHKPRVIMYKCVVTCCCCLCYCYFCYYYHTTIIYDTGAACNYLFLDYTGLIHIKV